MTKGHDGSRKSRSVDAANQKKERCHRGKREQDYEHESIQGSGQTAVLEIKFSIKDKVCAKVRNKRRVVRQRSERQDRMKSID